MHPAGYYLLSVEAMQAGYMRAIGVFQLVLLLWCGVHILSQLEQQPAVHSSYLSMYSGSNEAPDAANPYLRGRVLSLGAQDCHNALGKKGWDFVIGQVL